MSNTLHIHLLHEINYGSHGFNGQMTGLYGLLTDCGCEIEGELNDDSVGDWEIEEGQFIEAIKRIRKLPAETVAGYFNEEYVGDDKKKFKKDIISCLQRFADTGDHHNGYYYFSWF